MTSQLFGNDEQLDKVAEDFVERFRRGEYPSLDEYCRRYPDLAKQMRELFPALVEMARAERAMGHPTAPLRQVGDYRIIREVGRGGMGVVYEAEQASLGRRVALKVLTQRNNSDVNAVERFRREARAAARLHHTNIVPVFEVGRDGDICYYAMQFITGQGLDKIIHELRSAAGSTIGPPSVSDTSRRDAGELAQSVLTGAFRCPDAGATPGPSELHGLDAIGSLESASDGSTVSLGQAEFSAAGSELRPFFESVARIGRQTASALAHAHQRGVIHRDVKPSNLLLDASGAVWVTDFGLAKTDEADLTRTGDILGTIRYMSPERFRGCSDARGDVYALGMTLRELLVLRPAFESADRAALVAMIASDEPTRPRAIDPRIPGDLETIVLKATAKEPGRRYQTADEMAEDLRRFLDGEPIKARRVGALGRARLFCRRNPALALLYGVLFAVALGASAAAVYLSVTVREKERAERRAVEELFSSLVAQADASRSSRRVGQRFETLETVKKAVALARNLDLPPERLHPLRTVAVAALALPDIRVAEEWQPFGTDFTGTFAADVDHRLVAVALRSGYVVVCRMSDHREVARVPYRAEIVNLSPNGRFLMAIDDKSFRVWDVNGPEPKVVVPDTENHGAVFRPDSRYLAIGRADRTLVMIDLYGQEPERVWRPPCMKYVRPKAFDPSGKRLVVIIDSTANVFDVSVPTNSYLHLSEAGQYDSACWHPNGRYVALVNVSKTIAIEIWDVERNRVIGPPLLGCVNGGFEMSFTPDGELLVSWGWEGNVRVWQFRTGRQVLQYPGAYSVHFGRDGGCLFMANQRLVRAEFVASNEYRVFGTQLRLPIALWRGSIHPDGRLLAACSDVGMHFWDLLTGDEVAFSEQLRPHDLAFASPDELVILSKTELAAVRVSTEGPGKSLFRIGLAKRLNVGAFADFSCSTDGTTLAQAMFEANGIPKGVPEGVSLFVRHDREWVRRPFDAHVHANCAVVSPDGAMVATPSFQGEVKTRVWATANGRQLAAYDTWGWAAVAFSPNNRWLAVGSSGLSRIIPVGDWDSGAPFDAGNGIMCFSPSSDLLAVETGTGAVQCFDPETGRKLVRLDEPNQIIVRQVAFTSDGTRLVTISDESKAIQVWDLRRIRAGLNALGLDWNAPPLPPANETDQGSKPRLRVEVEPVPIR